MQISLILHQRSRIARLRSFAWVWLILIDEVNKGEEFGAGVLTTACSPTAARERLRVNTKGRGWAAAADAER